MKLTVPDNQVFIRRLEERGVTMVQEDIRRGRYGPPYEDIAREWVDRVEKANIDQNNAKTLKLMRWQIALAILGVIVAILLYLLSQKAGR
jgi:hypothetical protein